MCFESIIGFSMLALVLIGYAISCIVRNINWAMLGHYLRSELRTW